MARAIRAKSGGNGLGLALIGGGVLAAAWYLSKSSVTAASIAQTTPAGAANQPPPGAGAQSVPVGAEGYTAPAIAAEAANQLLPIDITVADQSAGILAPSLIEVQSSGTYWDTLTPAASLASGWIDFPTGSQAAASLMQVRTDANNNSYVEWAGRVYQIVGPDAAGNYLATLSSQQ